MASDSAAARALYIPFVYGSIAFSLGKPLRGFAMPAQATDFGPVGVARVRTDKVDNVAARLLRQRWRGQVEGIDKRAALNVPGRVHVRNVRDDQEALPDGDFVSLAPQAGEVWTFDD